MRRSIAIAVLLASALTGHAAVRLTYPMGGTATPIYWPSDAFPIEYKIDRRVAETFSGAAGVVERSFNAWTNIGDANLSFRSLGIADGLKAGFDHQNSVTIADDLYKDQGFIAVTTNWYDDRGRMTEADIQIDASLVTSSYNVQQTIEHEVGHLLGLDHSAVLTSVMNPYVGRGGTTALDSDDRIAIAALYPKADPALVGATLTGRVVGDSGGVFAAQVVALNERGEPVITGLTNESGEFVLRPVPAGTYRLYAEPLDGPVDPKNLAGVWRAAKVVSFPTEFLSGPPLSVTNGKVYGNLVVNTAGAPVRLNPKWIGATPEAHAEFTLSATPVTLRPGQKVSLAIAGDGFTSGMTTFEVLNPGVQRVSDFRWAANYVYATFAVSPDAHAGSAVILVRSGSETATLTGALRIEAPARTRAVRS